ncbi:hypothetical protein E4U61_006363 [Claviceps capensis]|nr:hypothetical protein E4U61_006363 [Claviceps capensis]
MCFSRVVGSPGAASFGAAGSLRSGWLPRSRRLIRVGYSFGVRQNIRDHSSHLVCESREKGQGAGVGGTGAGAGCFGLPEDIQDIQASSRGRTRRTPGDTLYYIIGGSPQGLGVRHTPLEFLAEPQSTF